MPLSLQTRVTLLQWCPPNRGWIKSTGNKAEINMNCHALVTKYTLIQAMHYAASAVDSLYTHPLFDMVGLAFIKISMCLTVCHLW